MKTDNPLVTVIVPAYNVEKYIARCLNSIIQQTYPNLEVLVIDDGSNDNTSSITKSMAEKDSRIIYIRQTGQGVSAARNRGIHESHGDYIFWVDADDYISQMLIENCISVFRKNHADIVVYGSQTVKDGKPLEAAAIPPSLHTVREWYREAVLDKISKVWSYAAKAELWRNTGFSLDFGHMGEDGIATIDIFKKAQKITAIPLCLYYYNRGNENSLTRQVSSEIFYELMEAWVDREKICEAEFPESRGFCMQRVLAFAVKSYCLSLVGNELGSNRKTRILDILGFMNFSLVQGRRRDKLLRWAAIHGWDYPCRWYGQRKYRKLMKQRR